MSEHTQTTPAVVPVSDPAQLDDYARAYMLGWLSSIVEFAPITREDWLKAYGAAADRQTVQNARRELAVTS
jgi:hypothetical protein